MLTDIQIAQSTKLRPIDEIAEQAGIDEKYLERYGNYKAKVKLGIFDELKDRPKGKLIYVTAITPTPAGRERPVRQSALPRDWESLTRTLWSVSGNPPLGPPLA